MVLFINRRHSPSRTNYFQGAEQRGWLNSGFLSVGFNSNRIETLLAATAVTLDQPPVDTNSAHRVEKKLSCEILKMRFYTNGFVQSAVAETNVFAQQMETRAGRARATQTELRAGLAKLFFFAHTNQVREMIAEREVSIVQDTKSAQGDRAVYTAANDIVQLSGSPTADMPLGRITEAEVLIWDRGHNTLKAKGKTVVGVGEVPGKRPPRTGLLLPK